jgi:hypothetical protein
LNQPDRLITHGSDGGEKRDIDFVGDQAARNLWGRIFDEL